MTHARWVLAQCDRFHVLPSQIDDEDAELLRLLALEELAGGD